MSLHKLSIRFALFLPFVALFSFGITQSNVIPSKERCIKVKQAFLTSDWTARFGNLSEPTICNNAYFDSAWNLIRTTDVPTLNHCLTVKTAFVDTKNFTSKNGSDTSEVQLCKKLYFKSDWTLKSMHYSAINLNQSTSNSSSTNVTNIYNTNIYNSYTDVDDSTLEGQAVKFLTVSRVINGFEDGSFKGSKFVNRAEAAKFLLVAKLGTVVDRPNNGQFADVVGDKWYIKYISEAADQGIINGYHDGSFRPARTVTVAEFLKMLTHTFQLPVNLPHDYSDVESSDWYNSYAGVAKKYFLFPDKTTQLNPKSQMSRTDVSIAMYQYFLNKEN